MAEKTIVFLQNRFRSFYKENFVDSVPEIEKREFGYGDFGKKIVARHCSFGSVKEFNSFLRHKTPFFVSFSPALYEFPDRRPMQNKNYLKSDLIYEFDADDLKTECKQRHDSWKCSECNASGNGIISECTSCGSTKIEKTEWVCTECLEATKQQTLKLLSFLEKDFDFTEGIYVNFSGSKGFHIHLRDEKIQELTQNARIELLDFLTAKEIDLKQLGFFYENKKMLCPKEKSAFGWSRKLIDKLKELIQEEKAEKISAFGNSRISTTKKFLQKKDLILKGIENGFLFPVPNSKKFWNSLLQNLIEEEKLFLDRQTSMDLSKIIRVPDSIHGSTGLIAKRLELSELKKFKPFNESIIFSNNALKVFVKKAPKFSLGGESFGPFELEETELPEFAAIYLMARNSAEVV
jgi:DNA primase small subunit